jgi:hypothetical protein
MSDDRQGLPVVSEMDVDKRVQIKICDATSPSQQAGVSSAGDLQVVISGEGSVGNTDQSTVGLVAATRGATPGRERLAEYPTTTAPQAGITCLDIALHDNSGNSFSSSNPLPVSIVSEGLGQIFHRYGTTASDIASGSSGSIEFSPGTSAGVDDIFSICRLSISSSSAYKVVFEKQTGASTWEAICVRFGSVSNPNVEVKFDKELKLLVNMKVRAYITNTDKGSKGFYFDAEGVLLGA